jgi:hypothetical protein
MLSFHNLNKFYPDRVAYTLHAPLTSTSLAVYPSGTIGNNNSISGGDDGGVNLDSQSHIYVNNPYYNSVIPNGTPFSMGVWCKFHSSYGIGENEQFSSVLALQTTLDGNGNNDRSFQICLKGSTDSSPLQIRVGSGDNSTDTALTRADLLDNWYFFGVTWDGGDTSGIARLYYRHISSSSLTTYSLNFGSIPGGNYVRLSEVYKFYIGANRNIGAFVDGEVKDFRFFYDKQLTEAELLETSKLNPPTI